MPLSAPPAAPAATPRWQDSAAAGRDARARGEHESALAHFQAGLALAPGTVSLQIDVATALRELQRYDEAEAWLRAVVAREPATLAAWTGLAYTARRRGLRHDALESFRRALALKPEHPTLAIEIAGELRALGRHDEAAATLESQLARHPATAAALLGLAQCERLRGRRERCLALLLQAQALEPGRAATAIEIATELREQGRFDEAEQCVGDQLALHPGTAGLWTSLAYTARRRGRREQALAHFQHAQELDPGHATLPLEVAAELRELGRLDEARALLQALPASGKVAAAVWLQLGQVAQYRDDSDEALRCFEQGIQAAPDQPGCYLALAGECQRLGLLERAESRLRAGIAQVVPPLRLELALARLERGQGRLYEALARAELRPAEDAGQFETQMLRVQILTQLGRFDDAESLIDEMAQRHALEAAPLALLQAQLARARYDLPQAQAHLDTVLRLQPDHAEALQLRALVALMRGDSAAAAGGLDAARQVLGGNASQRRRDAAGGGLRTMIWRETRTNPFAEAALQQALALPPERQVDALAEAVAAEPGHFGSAVAWLVALHRAGAWQRWRPAAAAGAAPGGHRAPAAEGAARDAVAIPHTIVQFWDSADIPADIRATMQSWPENGPGFEHRVFDDASADAFIAAHCDARVLRAFRCANHPAMRSDLFRLAWLSVHGGVYADADDLCRRSVAPWLAPGTELVLLQEDIASIGNNFIAAAPRHPFIAAALADVVDNVLARAGETVWFISGPGALTTTFCRHFHGALRQARLPDGVRVFDVYRMQQQAISMHLPRSYKQDERHWSKARDAARPLFRPVLAGMPAAAREARPIRPAAAFARLRLLPGVPTAPQRAAA